MCPGQKSDSMGAIMNKTIKQWADSAGVNPDSARKKASRTFGGSYGLTSVLSDFQWEQLYPSKSPGIVVSTPKEKSKFVPAGGRPAGSKENSPAPLEKAWNPDKLRRAMLDIILIGIVTGHAGLIWYDCAVLWDTPGAIGGGLAFFIIVAAVMLATDPSKNISSQWGLFLALLVDAGAGWVHYPVFQNYRVSDDITLALVAFLCAMSFGALFLYRHQKNN